ncbi:hypothetical protein Ciccas_013275 [Cichlidogyrus casuarinus]|uniref:Fibronectin type-III domain-containing protein n=1 Tax=Cichlidogyrus casuarinus TaxID=1844966 RepID=A0ABD2PR36_9PLAT
MNFVATERTQNSIKLSWNAPVMSESTTIGGYSLSYKETDTTSPPVERMVPNTSPSVSWTVIGLNDCTKYEFILTAKSSDEVYCDPLKSLKVMTMPEPPTPVAKLSVSSADSNQILVEITPSDVSTRCSLPIAYRIMLLQGSKEINQIQTQMTRYAFTSGLQPNIQYTVTVKTVHMGEDLTSSAKTVDVQTAAASSNRPQPPNNLNASDVMADAIRISWSKPTSGAVSAYNVFYTDGNETGLVKIKESTTTSFLITALRPCTEYSITLQTVATVQEIDYLSEKTGVIKVKTANPVPSTPSSITLTQISETAINIKIPFDAASKCGSVVYALALFRRVNGRAVTVLNKYPTAGGNKLTKLNQLLDPYTSVAVNDLEPGYIYYANVANQDSESGKRGDLVQSADLFLLPDGLFT